MDLVELFIVDETKSLNLAGLVAGNPGIEVLGDEVVFSMAVQKLNILVPDLILYSPLPDGKEFDRIQQMSNLAPQSSIMVLAKQTEADYVRDCLRAGAADYLLLPVEASVLQSEVEKAHRRHARRKQKEKISVLMERFTGKPKLLGFISAKGGVGKTTVAVNTAVTLARQNRKVVLVDMDSDMGGVDVFLNVAPQDVPVDLSEIPLDSLTDVILDYVEWHDSGLAVLCTASMSSRSPSLTPARLRVILQALQRHFQYVVIDMPPIIDTYFLSVFEIANECYMISTPNLAVLTVNRKLLALFYKLGYDTAKIIHILNCAGIKHGVTAKDAQRLLKASIGLTIPYDFRNVELAANRGAPLVMEPKPPAISKSFRSLAKMISGSRTGNSSAESLASAPKGLVQGN